MCRVHNFFFVYLYKTGTIIKLLHSMFQQFIGFALDKTMITHIFFILFEWYALKKMIFPVNFCLIEIWFEKGKKWIEKKEEEEILQFPFILINLKCTLSNTQKMCRLKIQTEKYIMFKCSKHLSKKKNLCYIKQKSTAFVFVVLVAVRLSGITF